MGIQSVRISENHPMFAGLAWQISCCVTSTGVCPQYPTPETFDVDLHLCGNAGISNKCCQSVVIPSQVQWYVYFTSTHMPQKIREVRPRTSPRLYLSRLLLSPQEHHLLRTPLECAQHLLDIWHSLTRPIQLQSLRLA